MSAMWKRVREIFEAALEHPTAEREAFVENECVGDEHLRTEILSLLAGDRASGPLGKLPPGLAAATGDFATFTGNTETVVTGSLLFQGRDLRRMIGPYRVLESIGAGGMGVVYHAVHPISGEEVAVKTTKVRNASLLSSFRREAVELSRLKHPGVVRVIDSGVDGDVPWYAMELLQGRTLGALIRDVWRDADISGVEVEVLRLLGIARDLCPALEFIHGEGIVHRDLKPENVIVLPDGSPVVVDFGIVATAAPGREVLDVAIDGAGTASYMAPEQIRGDLADARSDLYALGCILFEILTGTLPYADKDRLAILMGHLEKPIRVPSELNPSVPIALDALVVGLLAKAPRDRIGHAAAVERALAEAGAPTVLNREAPAARQYLYRPSFAGRDRSLEFLGEKLEDLMTGRGGLTFVAGESGVGKTRLVLEFARRSKQRGAQVMTGECMPAEGRSRAFQPLSALKGPLSSIVDKCRERGRTAADSLLGENGKVLAIFEPAIAALPGQDNYPEPPGIGDEASRQRVFRALLETFDKLSVVKPLVLVLDDLQWADELTLGFLEYLRAELATHPSILVLGTLRSDEADPRLTEISTSFPASCITLGRLDDESVATIVGEMLASPVAPTELSKFVARQSEGNPFYVAEYLRAAVEEGLLRRGETGAWQVVGSLEDKSTDFTRLGLPGSLRSLVSRRLSDLPEGARRVVAAASVLGREFDTSNLGGMVDADDLALLDALGELVRRHVFELQPSGSMKFAHDSLREVAYSEIPVEDRPELHRKAAEALSSSIEPGELARHWELARELDRASDCYMAAAHEAKARYAIEATERYYRAIIAIGTPDSLVIQARIDLASPLLRWQGRIEEATEQLNIAVEAAHRLGDLAIEAACLRRLGAIQYDFATLEGARESWEKALALSRRAGDLLGEARTLNILGFVASDSGNPEAESLYSEAVEIYRTLGKELLLAETEEALATLYLYRKGLAASRTLHESALQKFRELGAIDDEAVALVNLAEICAIEGKLTEARSLCEQAIPLHKTVGNKRFGALVTSLLGCVTILEGREEEGRAILEEAFSIFRKHGFPQSEAETSIRLASVERRLGRLDKATALLDRAADLLANHGDAHLPVLLACERVKIAHAVSAPCRDLHEVAERMARDIDAHPDGDVGVSLNDARQACPDNPSQAS